MVRDEVFNKHIYIIKTRSEQHLGSSPGKKGSPREEFETRLRELRLQQSRREKQELESKIQQLGENIRVLASPLSEPDINASKPYSWLTNKDRQKWKDDWQQKVQHAEELAKKVGLVQKEIKQRMKEKRKQEREGAQQAEEKAKQAEKDREEEQRKKKEEAKAKIIERLEAKKKEQVVVAANKKPKSGYLHEKMAEKFVKEVELPELEKRKQEIAEKRNLYKPIRKPDIEQGQKEHEEFLKKSAEDRRRSLLDMQKRQDQYMHKVKKELQSVFTQQLLVKEQEQLQQLSLQGAVPKEKYTRRLQYAQNIKESFKPSISLAKAKELQDKIEKLKCPVKKPHEGQTIDNKKAKSQEEPKRQRGTSLAGGSKDRNEDKPKRVRPQHTEPSDVKGKGQGNEKEKEKGQKRTKDTAKEGKKRKGSEEGGKIDYLAELKKNHSAKGQGVAEHYKRIIQNEEMTHNDKYELINAEANKLEEEARRKEMLMKVKGGAVANLGIENEVSEKIISAMKAKLSLLDI